MVLVVTETVVLFLGEQDNNHIHADSTGHIHEALVGSLDSIGFGRCGSGRRHLVCHQAGAG